MRIFARMHQLPPRMAAGVYILNSGFTKAGADEEAAKATHGTAVTAYPFLRRVDPVAFTRMLSKTEMALGAALLVPAVPSLAAGAALTGFAAGLIGLYLRLPAMRQEGSLRPSEQGIGMAKDVWLLGIGLGLVIEEWRACRRH
ncbi:hypothetical protein [Nonomuraea aridisoli]|uniref:DoxX family membrane protein n=1 Tax=Nonomuraea aridisoli TaxID=2070368 RepID=A0A2W2DDB2_9ACTN|nr:hypothetical protein [Nonomuraea aridisoli]PZG08371.1 hypothetical protein C1J01_39170 [Nonomuraea aridisoli]